MLYLVIAVTILFAVNMGASGIAPSFAAHVGARMIKKRRAVILFGIFVIIGAIVGGRNVSVTLGKNLLPQEFISPLVALIILGSAASGLFLANILKIPQSTSQVAVGAIVGAGVYFNHLYIKTLFLKILPAWVILPLLSYTFTILAYRFIYPPRHKNLRFYEKILRNEKKLKVVSVIVGCYVAFAIGTNNVANAVGPLYGAGLTDIGLGLLLVSPLFGLGAMILGKGTLETAGTEIVPLGVLSGTLVSFVTASLLLVASILGIPQSLVQLNLCSIFAVAGVKNGHRYTLDKHITRKTFIVWAVTPLLSFGLSYLLLFLFVK